MPFLALRYSPKIVWILDIARALQQGLIINVMAIHRWKLPILSDLSTCRDYHSQIYTKAAHSSWCLNVIHTSVMQGCFLLWMRGWFTFQEERTFTIRLHARFAQKEKTQVDVYDSFTSWRIFHYAFELWNSCSFLQSMLPFTIRSSNFCTSIKQLSTFQKFLILTRYLASFAWIFPGFKSWGMLLLSPWTYK